MSRFHTETAIDSAGVGELVDEALREAPRPRRDDPAVGRALARLRGGREAGKAALDAFETHLRDAVLPRSEGEGRLGAELFAPKLRHTLRPRR